MQEYLAHTKDDKAYQIDLQFHIVVSLLQSYMDKEV